MDKRIIPHSKITIGKEEIKAVVDGLKHHHLANGPIVEKFEKDFSIFLDKDYSIGVNSGSSALHLALIALNIKPGDEIILPSYVCTSVLNAILYVAAIPLLVDINWDDFNINVNSVKEKITSKTKAIIVPHMFGQSADMTELLQFNIPIIEDCALSVGTTYKKQPVGTFGDLSIFSFYATKVITSIEGGMIVTDNYDYYKKISDIKDTDKKETYKVRYNYKMTDIGAAIGREQLKKLNEFIIKRQDIAEVYNKELSNLEIELPIIGKNKIHIYFRYVIKVENGINEIIEKLKNKGIDARKPVFKPLHQYLGLKDSDYPITTKVFNSAISIPIYPGLKNSEIKFIITILKNILRRK